MADTRIKAGQFFGVVGHGTDGYFLMTNADGSMSWAEGGASGPSVTSVDYPGDDTAADPAGGQTVVLTGTNFGSSMTVSIGGTTAPSVAHDSNTQLTISTPAKAAGDYDIVVTNTVTGASGTFVNGISYNGIPTWTTAAGSLGTFESETTISTITLAATEPDGGTITFNITNGALPTGLSLTGANIDGTTTAESSTTLYSFTIEAIDDENQATPRNFSITVNSAEIIPSQNFTINTYTGNGSTQSIEGKIGTAASFNGTTSQIRTVGNPIPSTSSVFTVSFWFQLDNTNTNNHIFSIFDNVAGTNKLLIRALTAGDFQAGVYGTSGSNFITTTSSTFSYTTGVWYHLVYISTSNGNNELWIDGTQIATSTGVAANTTSSSIPVTMGGRGDLGASTTERFGGKIDQVRIFNKGISSSEVTTLYGENNASSTKSTTDIFDDGSGVALYEFEEGANDSSGTISVPTHYFFVTDAGNQNSSARLNSVDSEFTYSRPSGYSEWGGTFDPNNDYGNSATLSESNKKWDKVGTYYNSIWSTNSYNSGKYYFELEFLGNELSFGITKITAAEPPFTDFFKNNSINYGSWATISYKYSTTNTNSGVTLSINDVIGFAVDFDNGELKYYRNNTLIDTVTMPSSDYNGTPTNVSFVGTSFQPDLVWIKNRDAAHNHILFDSVRGDGNSNGYYDRIMSNTTDAQQDTVTDAISSLDSNGFTVVSAGSGSQVNNTNDDYVSWCWKAADTTTTISAGTVGNTIASDVRANQDAGFSIVKWTGTGANATVGHGLSSAPELILLRPLERDSNWFVYNSTIGNTEYLMLNRNFGSASAVNIWNNTSPTSSVFSLTGYIDTNGLDEDIIAYCFHSVDGYQKVGSYTGTGQPNNDVTTGFRPRWVMIKNTAGEGWNIVDSVRNPSNPANLNIQANDSAAESSTGNPAVQVDFDDTGFSLVAPAGTPGEGQVNSNGSTYIYLAIA